MASFAKQNGGRLVGQQVSGDQSTKGFMSIWLLLQDGTPLGSFEQKGDGSFHRIPLPSVWIIELGGKSRWTGMAGPWTRVMAMKKISSNCPEILYPAHTLKVKPIGFADD